MWEGTTQTYYWLKYKLTAPQRRTPSKYYVGLNMPMSYDSAVARPMHLLPSETPAPFLQELGTRMLLPSPSLRVKPSNT